MNIMIFRFLVLNQIFLLYFLSLALVFSEIAQLKLHEEFEVYRQTCFLLKFPLWKCILFNMKTLSIKKQYAESKTEIDIQGDRAGC